MADTSEHIDGVELRVLESVLSERKAQCVKDMAALEQALREKIEAQHVLATTTIAAMDRATVSAFAAAKEAILKAEEAQSGFNARSNEFRQTLDDWQKNVAIIVMPRLETEARLKVYDDKLETIAHDISSLRESRSEYGGRDAAVVRGRSQSNWSLGTLSTLLLGLLAAGVALITALLLRK